MKEALPYRDLNSYLKERFGARVQKVTLDAGLTCPNRDGRVGGGGLPLLQCPGLGHRGLWPGGQYPAAA